jgi:hypothetical protein
MLLSRGQVFGEESLLIDDALPLYSIRCRSAFGEVLFLSEAEFIKRIKSNPKSFEAIQENCEYKTEQLKQILSTPYSYINLQTITKFLESEAKHEEA